MSGSITRESPYWINEPPIVELRSDEVEAAGTRLAQSIEAYGAISTAESDVPALRGLNKLNPAAWKRRKSHKAEEREWHQRGSTAIEVAKSMGAQQPYGGYDKVYAYRLYGVEVAMMCLSFTNGVLYIKWLATHPGTSGGGEIMIEAAASRSQRGRCNGVVRLSSLTQQSTDFYSSVGFKDLGQEMELDPAKNDLLWEMVGNDAWRLRKHQNKRFAPSLEA